MIPDWIDLRNPPEQRRCENRSRIARPVTDAVWQEILASGQIELPDLDDAFAKAGSVTLAETFEWLANEGVSVNRKRLREALERRAKRLHARVEERRRVRHLVEEACRGQGRTAGGATRKTRRGF